jgi:hypothetical protein
MSEFNTRMAPYEANPDAIEPGEMMKLAQQHAQSPEFIRAAADQRMIALCTDLTRAHIVFSALHAYPMEARQYLEHGLSLPAESISLLVAAESFLLEHGGESQLENVRGRIQTLGVAPASSNHVQDWIDRYTYLTNDFQYFRPETDFAQTGPELVELEARLNHHWLSFLPEPNAPSCPPIENELISQNRFLSAGSASYVGWLRTLDRHDEVVEYMATLTEELQLSLLRYRTSPPSFEGYLNNGLGSFLDSKKDDHITKAISIMDALEAVIPKWEDGMALYNLGCIAARAVQLERAMNYVRQAVSNGRPISAMASDDDFENLWHHPDFVALREAS